MQSKRKSNGENNFVSNKKQKIGTSKKEISINKQHIDYSDSSSIARHCKVQTEKENGKNKILVSFDNEKLNNALDPAEIEDQLLLQNLVSGAIVTGKLWPLMIETSSHPLAFKRTLAFMQEVFLDASKLSSLNEQEVLYFCVGVRDLWLADMRGWLDQHEKQILNKVLDLLDDDFVPSAEFQSMPFSFCPSKNKRILKFVERLDELSEMDKSLLQSVAKLAPKNVSKSPSNIDSALKGISASMKFEELCRYKGSTNNEEKDNISAPLYAIWVDGRDLSYHNFECILPLDRALNIGVDEHIQFTASPLERLSYTMHIYKTSIGGSLSLDLLLQLDQLGLYQKPSNASTRGGERFIFSSEKLSTALTDVFHKMQNKFAKDIYLDDSFVAVNHVFRCNRFAPGDAKFESHMDTPYYDPRNRHISRYTVIIYLSGRSGSPILKLWNNSGKDNNKMQNETFELTDVKQFDCVIFDQQYCHEGNPFLKFDKVFLRSELIFNCDKYDTLDHVPEVGKVFSSAVYMTLQSTFQPALSRYAHDLYERVNALHWGLKDDTSMPPLVLQKKWRDKFVFATNGCDYWFPYVHEPGSVNDLPHEYLKQIAVIAILDYFNGRSRDMGETANNNIFTAFGLQCTSKIISDPSNPATQTSAFILSKLWTKARKLQNGAKKPLLKPINSKAIQRQYLPGIQKDDTQEKIVIENDKILFGYGLDPLFCNFASAMNEYDDARKNLQDIAAPQLLVPPISFVAIPASEDNETGPGFLLLLDFFKNNWAVPSVDKLTHCAPTLTNKNVKEYFNDYGEEEEFENDPPQEQQII